MLKSKFWHISKSALGSRYFWVLLLFVGAVLFRFWSQVQEIQKETVNSWNEYTEADCGVVLTGGAGRVREGFDLLANQRVKKLVVSGVYSSATMREIMPVWSFYGTLSENDVVLEKRSETTFGNAQQSLAIVDALKCRDIVLITSRLHMFRAYKTFRATYPENIHIHKHAILGGRFETSLFEIYLEAGKSFFYSLWAY